MNEWKPISEAPKDADILIATSEGYVGQGNFRDYMEGEDDAWWWSHEEIIQNPTHWMPLPAPPVDEKAQQG